MPQVFEIFASQQGTTPEALFKQATGGATPTTQDTQAWANDPFKTGTNAPQTPQGKPDFAGIFGLGNSAPSVAPSSSPAAMAPNKPVPGRIG